MNFLLEQLFSLIFCSLVITLVNKMSNLLYRGYSVVIRKGDTILCIRKIGPGKAKEILDDETTLSVYLKGVVSPFCFLTVDILSEEAKVLGLFYIQKKCFTVDISKNPPKAK